ncbi:MAG: metallo-mystery pair system four-Cys motif protein [Candidatus Binatia bacterium]|nr:metallo-mystery pair system four-Cys motif protein [Candidatus Binatia bacterium]
MRGAVALSLLLTALAAGRPSDGQSLPYRFDALGQCVGDRNSDGEVTVDELVAGVNNILEGCVFQRVEIRFRGQVGDEPFQCGATYNGVGQGGSEFTPSDFRFYVSNVRLLTADAREVPVLLDQDGIWQLEDVALIDFENKTSPCVNGTVLTNDTIRGRVAPGDYNGIRFVLGVPFRLNHGDASVAPPPLSLTAMFWSWQAGYKFLRVDTAFDNYRVHLGSTGCFYAQPGVVGGCARPNRAEIILRPFSLQHDAIVADLAALLENSDLNANVAGTPPGCMSDPGDSDCQAILQNLGVDFVTGLPVPALQKFFRVAPQH